MSGKCCQHFQPQPGLACRASCSVRFIIQDTLTSAMSRPFAFPSRCLVSQALGPEAPLPGDLLTQRHGPCSQPPGPRGHSRSCSWFTLFFLLLQIQPQKGGAGADSSATPDQPQQHPRAGAGGVRGIREQCLQFRFLIRGGLNEAFLGFSSVRKFAFLRIRKS